MTDFLEDMRVASARRAAESRARTPLSELRRRALDRPAARALRLDRRGFDVLAEVKFASPSAGLLVSQCSGEAARERALAYAHAGAAGISVLTEPTTFGGALDHVSRIAEVSPVPVLRKDFLVAPYQVHEARAAGADGVLLILKLLDDETLAQMLAACAETGMFALLEAFDGRDLVRIGRRHAARAEPDGCRWLAGLNCRNLRTLEVEFERFARLSPLLPNDLPAVAESGLAHATDAARVRRAGYRLALIGTALMRARDPAEALAGFLMRGREQGGMPCAFS